MRNLVLLILTLLSVRLAYAQQPTSVTYLEKVGNGGTRVFSVTVPADKENRMVMAANKAVINALLFEGVENYNNGMPLVDNPSDVFALSLIDDKKLLYNSYCKETLLENSNPKIIGHYIVIVNNFNLIKTLKTRGSLTSSYTE